MKRHLGEAVKFRDHIIKDLHKDHCLQVWKGDRTFADDLAARIANAHPFYLRRDAIQFLKEHSMALGEEEFFTAISNMRLPFHSVWIEFDATAPKGYPDGRIGAMIDFIDDGLSVNTAKLIKLPNRGNLVVLYSGSEVLIKRDGGVELSDTPITFVQDLMTEKEKGRYRRSDNLYDPIPLDTVQEREQEALRDAILSVAKLLSISALHNRPEILEMPEPTPVSSSKRKKFERQGEVVPKLDLSIVRLGKEGRAQSSPETNGEQSSGTAKRAAHWVRGHQFLARNGKLTWRRHHIRGVGKPLKTPKAFQA